MKTRNDRDSEYSVNEEIANVLSGYATTNPATDPTLTRAAGWKARCTIVRSARQYGVLNALSDEAIDAIATGAVDAALLYREALSAGEQNAASGTDGKPRGFPAPTTALFAWEHVQESGRPSDTGRRTAYGHRLISRPRDPEDSIEFPYNSGRLISPEIYERRLVDAGHEAAPAMLAALRAWKALADDAGWSPESDMYRATVGAIAAAEGM